MKIIADLPNGLIGNRPWSRRCPRAIKSSRPTANRRTIPSTSLTRQASSASTTRSARVRRGLSPRLGVLLKAAVAAHRRGFRHEQLGYKLMGQVEPARTPCHPAPQRQWCQCPLTGFFAIELPAKNAAAISARQCRRQRLRQWRGAEAAAWHPHQRLVEPALRRRIPSSTAPEARSREGPADDTAPGFAYVDGQFRATRAQGDRPAPTPGRPSPEEAVHPGFSHGRPMSAATPAGPHKSR